MLTHLIPRLPLEFDVNSTRRNVMSCETQRRTYFIYSRGRDSNQQLSLLQSDTVPLRYDEIFRYKITLHEM